MSSIDRRIVDMRFNNRDFQKNARDTVNTLEDLKGALNLDGAASGLGEVEKSAGRFSFRNITDGIKNAVDNFPILGAVGFSAINKLTSSAIDFGRKFTQNVIAPITEGGKRRAMNIEQAQFQLEGLGVEWREIEPAILGSVLGTAYGLDEAARAAAQLSASQVPLDRMESSLRGISGAAAMTGSDYESMASVFTKVAGQGRLMGDDLLRLSSRGMNAAATLAEAMNITEAEVREMVTAGQIDFETFATAMDDAFGEHATKANETYTGALANMNAALARVGASGASIKMEKQRRQFNALSGVIDDVADALKPLWDLIEVRSVRSAIRFENAISSLRERFAGDFAEGVKAAVRGLWNIQEFFDRLSETARNAWQSVFPPGEGGQSTFFTNLGEGFESLTEWLNHTDGLLTVIGKVLTVIFTGLRYTLDGAALAARGIGIAFAWVAEQAQWLWQYIQPVFDDIGGFFRNLDFGGGSISGGNFIEQLTESLIWLKDMAMIPIQAVMDRLTPAFDAFLAAAETGGNRVQAFFGAFEGLMGEIREAVGNINLFDNAFVDFFRGIGERIASAWAIMKPPLTELWDFIKVLAGGFKEAFKGLSGDDVTSAVNAGAIAAVAAVIIGFIKDIEVGTRGVRQGIFRVNNALNEFRVTLKAYQIGIHARTLLTIAFAIGVLAAAMWLMSKIPIKNLEDATLAMFALMGGMVALAAALAYVGGFTGVAKLPAIGTGLAIVTAALLTMVGALWILSTIDASKLTGATTALVVLMTALVALTAVMGAISEGINPGKLILVAVALNIMVAAIFGLGVAVAALGYLPYEVIEQGIMTVGILLLGLMATALVISELGPKLVLGAIGLVAIAVAINMLMVPLIALGLMDWEILEQGLMVLGILLAGLVVSAILIGQFAEGFILGAVGLLAMALALNMLVPSIVLLGMMDTNAVVQGLMAVGIAMAMLAITANAMTKALPGAAAVVFMAGAVLILTVAILAMAAIPFSALMQGMLGVAIALGLLIAAGALATFAAPGLLVLSLAAIALGGGMLMLSMGLMLFGPAAAVAAGGLALLGMAAAEMTPYVEDMLLVGLGLGAFGAGILVVAAAMTVLAVAMTIMGLAILALGAGLALLATFAHPAADAILYLTDQLTEIGIITMGKIAAVTVVLAALGAALLILGAGALLTGVGLLALAIGWAAASVAILLTANPLINALERMSTAIPPLMTTLGTSMMSAAITIQLSTMQIMAAFAAMSQRVVASVTSMTGVMQSAGQQLGSALIAGLMMSMPMVMQAGVLYVMTLTNTLMAGVAPVTSAATSLVKAFTTPLTRGARQVQTISKLLVNTYRLALLSGRDSVRSAGTSLANAAVSGMNSPLRAQARVMSNTGYNAGNAFSKGMAAGIRAGGWGVQSAARNVAGNAARAARQALDIHSPSREGHEIGRMFDLGIEEGMYEGMRGVEEAATEVGESSLTALRDAINEIGDEIADEFDDDFTIRPILDLSDVEGKAGMLSSMLEPAVGSGSPSAAQAGRFSTLPLRLTPQQSADMAATIVNFQQHNTSPKALPQSEIYRHTKNGLSRLRDSL